MPNVETCKLVHVINNTIIKNKQIYYVCFVILSKSGFWGLKSCCKKSKAKTSSSKASDFSAAVPSWLLACATNNTNLNPHFIFFFYHILFHFFIIICLPFLILFFLISQYILCIFLLEIRSNSFTVLLQNMHHFLLFH